MQFRRDIQILRGIAVLMVVIYHLFPAQWKSGYLGVDVFFVISGFLMASLYNRPGDKSPAKDFYRRRMHRILPAYFMMVILSTVVAIFIVLPHEMSALSKQAISSIFLVPNFYFWTGESYFDNIAFRPLLHTWSLGVELQFYLFVPLFYWLFKKSKSTFIILSLLSFIFCMLVLRVSPKSSFFILPFRVWEFSIGFIAALMFSKNGNQSFSNPWLGTVALLAILITSFWPTNLTVHPGYIALVVCLSTGLVIIFGLPSFFETSLVGRSLVGLGKYSYSLYLVHFPIIALIWYSPFAGDQHEISLNVVLGLGVIFMIGLTWISYNFIEVKKLYWPFTINSLVLVLGTFAIILAVASPGFVRQIVPKPVAAISFAIEDRSAWRCGKLGKLSQVIFSKSSCEIIAVPEASNHILLVGDSHADSLKSSLAKVAEEYGYETRLVVSSCHLGNGDCSVSNIIDQVKKYSIEWVFIHDLHYYTNYDQILELANKIGPEHVVFVAPIPTYKVHIPKYLYNSQMNIEQIPIEQDVEAARSRFNIYHENQQKLMKSGVKILDPIEYLCAPNCLIEVNGQPAYFDNHHLTLTGATVLEPMLRAFFQEKSR